MSVAEDMIDSIGFEMLDVVLSVSVSAQLAAWVEKTKSRKSQADISNDLKDSGEEQSLALSEPSGHCGI